VILFVNGDEHVVGACITNNYIYAEEDNIYNYKGKRPHPDNFKASWGYKLADNLAMKVDTDAPHQTNTQILESTNEWIERVATRLSPDDVFIIIGWVNPSNEENIVDIRNYHLYLQKLEIKHLFFNTETNIAIDFNFNDSYVDETYIGYLDSNGYGPVIMSDKYYSKEAHSKWANYLLKHIVKNKML